MYSFEWVSKEEELKFQQTLEFLRATKLSKQSPSYIVLMTKNSNPNPVGFVVICVNKSKRNRSKWTAIEFKSDTKPERQLLYDQLSIYQVFSIKLLPWC